MLHADAVAWNSRAEGAHLSGVWSVAADPGDSAADPAESWSRDRTGPKVTPDASARVVSVRVGLIDSPSIRVFTAAVPGGNAGLWD